MKQLTTEIAALKKVLEICLDHINEISTLATVKNTKEVFGEECEVTTTEIVKKDLYGKKPIEGYVIKTAGLYHGTPIEGLAKVNSKGLKNWIRETWKTMHAEDRKYIKQMRKDGRI